MSTSITETLVISLNSFCFVPTLASCLISTLLFSSYALAFTNPKACSTSFSFLTLTSVLIHPDFSVFFIYLIYHFAFLRLYHICTFLKFIPVFFAFFSFVILSGVQVFSSSFWTTSTLSWAPPSMLYSGIDEPTVDKPYDNNDRLSLF